MSETSTQAGGDSDATVIPAAGEFGGGGTTLRRGALGLTSAIVISVAVMSPAASIFFNTPLQAQFVGAAIPLCYVVGFLVALLVANQYSEFSRELPSSGSAYTFVREGLGARFGFLTGWIGLIAIVLGVPYSFVFMSANLADAGRSLVRLEYRTGRSTSSRRWASSSPSVTSAFVSHCAWT